MFSMDLIKNNIIDHYIFDTIYAIKIMLIYVHYMLNVNI